MLDLPDFLLSLHHRVPAAVEVALLVGISYLGLVRLLRWRRFNSIHEQYGAKYQAGTLTPQEAQRIMHVSVTYDMPLLLNKALAFALFKTYGIPSISKLLAATKELGSLERVSRRYADTEILISTWVGCPISGFLDPSFKSNGELPADDPRAMIALARTNYLHSKYKISNDDYLYTLCLFILEPPKWAALYGWRTLSPMECDSFYIFWADIGRKMGIKDIPESLEALKAWSESYAEIHMVPDPVNRDVAGFTTAELLHAVPNAFGLKRFAERITICVLEDRVRIAMLQPEQPWYLHMLVSALMASAWITQRWFLLPRISPDFPITLDLPKTGSGPCPRLYPATFRARPWYKPESSGLGYYLDKLLVKLGLHVEMPGPHLKSSGYRLEEMGPTQFENDGQEEVMRRAAELLGCPIVGPWSLQNKPKHGEAVANEADLIAFE